MICKEIRGTIINTMKMFPRNALEIGFLLVVLCEMMDKLRLFVGGYFNEAILLIGQNSSFRCLILPNECLKFNLAFLG
jgi:hypothetical protein